LHDSEADAKKKRCTAWRIIGSLKEETHEVRAKELYREHSCRCRGAGPPECNSVRLVWLYQAMPE